MGHGCHDCGCPNGCECPGSHGDWYKQRYELRTTDLEFVDWHHQFYLAKAKEREARERKLPENAEEWAELLKNTDISMPSAVYSIPRIPVDREADARLAKALKKRNDKHVGRKLLSQSDIKDRVRLIRLALHQDDPERATIMIDDLAFRLGIP